MQPTGSAGLRILFVCSSDLRSPSEKQVLWLSTHLAAAGHRSLISLRGDPDSARTEGAEGIEGVELRWHRFRGRRLSREDRAAAAGFRPDLIHAWNPRVPVIAAARSYSGATGAPVLVHWEDDEWGMPRAHTAEGTLRRTGQAARRAVARVQPSAWYLATEASIEWAASNSVAFDALTPILADYVRERTGRPCAAILPPLPSSPPGRAATGPELPDWATGRPLVALTGALLRGRLDDIRLALRGAAAARRRGADLVFVLAGRNLTGIEPGELAADAGLGERDFIFLDHVPYPSIPSLLARSAILLAVSQPTSLNVMCLPSKLQSYLVSGTPTVLSAHGAGELFEDRREVLKLDRPDPDCLGELIAALLEDPELQRILSEGGS
ncbi:MAG: glycosyltransferase family 4 protein, partial [Solirubrobacterales bacterium]|nr:glycosyltransferase family 4 protein [Solirubrobacterales bacterium]